MKEARSRWGGDAEGEGGGEPKVKKIGKNASPANIPLILNAKMAYPRTQKGTEVGQIRNDSVRISKSSEDCRIG